MRGPEDAGLPRLTGRRLFFIGIALATSVGLQFSVAWQLRAKIAQGFSDFSSFYTAAKIVDSGRGSELYDLAMQAQVEGGFSVRTNGNSFLPFNHAPFEALIFAPLGLVSYPTAFWIWWACNVPLCFVALYLLRSHIPRLSARAELVIVAVALFLPLLAAECQGQDSILTLLLFTVCFVFLVGGRAGLAGATLALAVYKPQLALAMLAMLALSSARRWRIVAGFLGTGVLLALVTAATVGWRACVAYPGFVRTFAAGFDDARLRTDAMPNLRGLLYAALGSHLSHRALTLTVEAATAALVLTAIWALRGTGGRGENMRLRFALLVTVTVLASYYGFFHDLTVLLLPLLLAANWLAEAGLGTWNRRLLAVALMILFCGPVISLTSPQPYACAAIVFFALLCREVRVSGAPVLASE